MKKRIISLLLSSALFVSMLAACGQQGGTSSTSSVSSESSASSQAEDTDNTASTDEITEIEFFQQQGEEAIQAGYQAIIEDFEKEYPNIKITMNTVPDSLKVLASRIATDDVPPLLTDWPTQSQFKEKVLYDLHEERLMYIGTISVEMLDSWVNPVLSKTVVPLYDLMGNESE